MKTVEPFQECVSGCRVHFSDRTTNHRARSARFQERTETKPGKQGILSKAKRPKSPKESVLIPDERIQQKCSMGNSSSTTYLDTGPECEQNFERSGNGSMRRILNDIKEEADENVKTVNHSTYNGIQDTCGTKTIPESVSTTVRQKVGGIQDTHSMKSIPKSKSTAARQKVDGVKAVALEKVVRDRDRVDPRKYGTLTHMKQVKTQNALQHQRLSTIRTRPNLFIETPSVKLIKVKSQNKVGDDDRESQPQNPVVVPEHKISRISKRKKSANYKNGYIGTGVAETGLQAKPETEYGHTHAPEVFRDNGYMCKVNSGTTAISAEHKDVQNYDMSSGDIPKVETTCVIKQDPSLQCGENDMFESHVPIDYLDKINADNAEILRRLDDILITMNVGRPESVHDFHQSISRVLQADREHNNGAKTHNPISDVYDAYRQPQTEEKVAHDDEEKDVPQRASVDTQSQIIQHQDLEDSARRSKSRQNQPKPSEQVKFRQRRRRFLLPFACCVEDTTLPSITPTKAVEKLEGSKQDTGDTKNTVKDMTKPITNTSENKATLLNDRNNNKRITDQNREVTNCKRSGKDFAEKIDDVNSNIVFDTTQGPVVRYPYHIGDRTTNHAFHPSEDTRGNLRENQSFKTVPCHNYAHDVNRSLGNFSTKSDNHSRKDLQNGEFCRSTCSWKLPPVQYSYTIPSNESYATRVTDPVEVQRPGQLSKDVGNSKKVLQMANSRLARVTADNHNVQEHVVTRGNPVMKKTTSMRYGSAKQKLAEDLENVSAGSKKSDSEPITDPKRYGCLEHIRQTKQQNILNRQRLRHVTTKLDTWHSDSTLQCMDEMQSAILGKKICSRKSEGQSGCSKVGEEIGYSLVSQKPSSSKPVPTENTSKRLPVHQTSYIPSWSEQWQRVGRPQLQHQAFPVRAAKPNQVHR